MSIKWTGIYAPTAFSTANNKTQDDYVVGHQDTIWVTGPGYGGYEGILRVHKTDGSVVAEIPVTSGGGPFSAPAPVRVLDDATTYSYSWEVRRGNVPTDDASGIVVEIIGGSSKRFPSPMSTSSDGQSIQFSQPVSGPVSVLGTSMRYDLPVFRRKLADVASNAGECIIGVIGDSHNLAVGGGSSGTYLLNDACRFAPAFVAGRKLAGIYGVPVNNDGWWGWRGYNGNATLSQFDPRWVITGTWIATSSSAESLGFGAMRETSGSGTATYTATRNWDKAEIWVQQNTGATGTLTASATGATSVPLTLTAGSATLTKFTLTKSAVDANPLVLTCSVAMSNYVGVAAINFIDSTAASVRIQNHALSGKTMADHVFAGKPYSNLNAYQVAGLSSDLLLVECLHNSIKGGAQTMSAWLADWETFLSTLDTAARDIVVYIGYPGNFSWATDGTMDAWIAALKAKLDSRQINLFDLRKIYGSDWATGNAAGLMYDADHPNKRGLALYGAKMAADLVALAAPW